MGDATRQRVDELADGWKVPKSPGNPPEKSPDAHTAETARVPKSEPEPDPPPTRAKRASVPPPPPGSSARAKRDSVPPPTPVPAPRSKRSSVPPPAPGSAARAKRDSIPPPAPPPRSAKPITEPSAEPSDDDESERDDPTRIEQPGDGPRLSGGAGGQLRRPQVVPRQRGLGGDVRYVFSALFRVTEARRELLIVNDKLETERAGRDQRLIQVARQAIADEEVTLAVVEQARDELGRVGEVRSKRAGVSAAAEAEIVALQRERGDESVDHVEQIKALEGEVADIIKRLEPLEKRAVVARKKATELQLTIDQLDDKIRKAKASLVSVKGPKGDPSAVEAEIASLRAEREAVAREEPPLAAELDELDPQIAALGAAQKEAARSIEDLHRREREAKERVDEMIEAVRARKAVEDRAVAEADRDRDEALKRLGERLSVDRPAVVAARLRPIDEHDLSIATLERRAFELGELVGGVDRAAIVRGVAVLVAGVAIVAGLLIWLLVLR